MAFLIAINKIIFLLRFWYWCLVNMWPKSCIIMFKSRSECSHIEINVSSSFWNKPLPQQLKKKYSIESCITEREKDVWPGFLNIIKCCRLKLEMTITNRINPLCPTSFALSWPDTFYSLTPLIITSES